MDSKPIAATTAAGPRGVVSHRHLQVPAMAPERFGSTLGEPSRNPAPLANKGRVASQQRGRLVKRTIFWSSLVAARVMTFPEWAQANSSEGPATARQGVVRCGVNNFLCLNGTEMHFTSYVSRNVDSTTPIVINRMRFFDATGAVLLDSAYGPLPPAENGVLGPTNNTLNPNQSAQYDSFDLLDFLTQVNRPGQFEIEWSAAKAALTLDVVSVRISRARNPTTGAILEERGRHAVECRTIVAK